MFIAALFILAKQAMETAPKLSPFIKGWMEKLYVYVCVCVCVWWNII